MLDWLDNAAGPDFARAVLWTIAALILLIIVLVVVRLIRSMTFGTFVAGGRNRKTRLAVMDATAVDSHRRLVLIRRDDIEHLLLIGGPTDVVVERDIRLVAQRRPVMTGEARQQASPKQKAGDEPAQPRQRPLPPPPAPAQSPLPTRAPAEKASLPPQFPALAASTKAPAYSAANTSYARPATSRPAEKQVTVDDEFLDDLEISLDELEPQAPATPVRPAPKAPATLDDEMTKLLGELSSQKK